MSLWTRITDAIEALRTGEPLSAVFDRLRQRPERTVAFTIGVIALGAKLAKADGTVTKGEVAAFRAVFTIPPEDEPSAARVFNLARQDVAGFDSYARKIAGLFPPDDPVLRDLMEGLFHIALADGDFHPAEDAFLREVAGIFGLGESCYRSMQARFVPGASPDPLELLELPQDATLDQARAAFRRMVRETHPDQLRARGVPDEAVRLAEERLKALNSAWEEVQQRLAA
ncbi:molecular chaperone DjiA [Pararhodobacter zhoushanensis]|uniref:Molecular chaperone DjiA n=1 Tax=Pararhodobacter zhoushanensis TaxID=2479545 RepID=A0ABT3H358_9RHOB|nr:molecular chaperone DjiA [Pararhodobacter zhoushanensis]MCW1934234.1 molecular chaperone DjiA [Pararhodobacter zhoushanensis]